MKKLLSGLLCILMLTGCVFCASCGGAEASETNVARSFIAGYENIVNMGGGSCALHSRAVLLFYQPPMLSFEVRGKMELIGEHHELGKADPFKLPLIQQFINAQHDVYHLPNIERWVTRPAYKFTVEEIWDNSANKIGFGTQIPF